MTLTRIEWRGNVAFLWMAPIMLLVADKLRIAVDIILRTLTTLLYIERMTVNP